MQRVTDDSKREFDLKYSEEVNKITRMMVKRGTHMIVLNPQDFPEMMADVKYKIKLMTKPKDFGNNSS